MSRMDHAGHVREMEGNEGPCIIVSSTRNETSEAWTPVYVCPDCRVPLRCLFCPVCQHEFACTEDGIPSLLSKLPRYERVQSIATVYEDIYTTRSNVWEDQGRTADFIRYFSGLLNGFPGKRYLEIGCGEGFLLASVRQRENFAVDLSLEAVRKARSRAEASFAQALSERLPFSAGYFDVVASVGVMEHFLDMDVALREIRRILKPGGVYVSLTHVDLSFRERLAARMSEFVFPRPRPVRLLRWLKERKAQRKLEATFPQQPIQNRYTTNGAKALIQRAGFKVRDVIHRRKNPELPLIGHYAVVYVAER